MRNKNSWLSLLPGFRRKKKKCYLLRELTQFDNADRYAGFELQFFPGHFLVASSELVPFWNVDGAKGSARPEVGEFFVAVLCIHEAKRIILMTTDDVFVVDPRTGQKDLAVPQSKYKYFECVSLPGSKVIINSQLKAKNGSHEHMLLVLNLNTGKIREVPIDFRPMGMFVSDEGCCYLEDQKRTSYVFEDMRVIPCEKIKKWRRQGHAVTCWDDGELIWTISKGSKKFVVGWGDKKLKLKIRKQYIDIARVGGFVWVRHDMKLKQYDRNGDLKNELNLEKKYTSMGEDAEGHLWLFDGDRTVDLFDDDGRLFETVELDLPLKEEVEKECNVSQAK
ncbi:hypothetical protein STSP2_00339 [Anaerohalosphaera lusitana]|uniref:Uncharacterized protein n=1 Tax=Anaerohalosphaera lusitana TaxID=1936003 RepID=A0A1U9NI57_9BACT|nr:hypothetical protein [Anaerohalosphaera lusitana]AQT67196.1 hypothetical protein STSP2_00339 [Anaerohalosphaera lusitana]